MNDTFSNVKLWYQPIQSHQVFILHHVLFSELKTYLTLWDVHFCSSSFSPLSIISKAGILEVSLKGVKISGYYNLTTENIMPENNVSLIPSIPHFQRYSWDSREVFNFFNNVSLNITTSFPPPHSLPFQTEWMLKWIVLSLLLQSPLPFAWCGSFIQGGQISRCPKIQKEILSHSEHFSLLYREKIQICPQLHQKIIGRNPRICWNS